MRDLRSRQAGSAERPAGLPVGALMSTPPVVVSAEATSADALHQLGHHTHDSYPVVGHDGRAIGLLNATELRAGHEGYAMLVEELTDTDRELLVEPWLDVVELVRRAAFRRTEHAVVVNREGIPVGIVSRNDLVSAHEQIERRMRVDEPTEVHS